MYTLDITFQEWELVYNARVGNRRPAWAKALIDAPLWPGADGVFQVPMEVAVGIAESFTNEFAGLDRNTLLFYKLHQFWNDLDLDILVG